MKFNEVLLDFNAIYPKFVMLPKRWGIHGVLLSLKRIVQGFRWFIRISHDELG